MTTALTVVCEDEGGKKALMWAVKTAFYAGFKIGSSRPPRQQEWCEKKTRQHVVCQFDDGNRSKIMKKKFIMKL